jgi:SagB-type dehydrogenase family enzyme
MVDALRGEITPLSGSSEVAWELFHENSKTSRFEPLLPADMLLEKMSRNYAALPFHGFPKIPLPEQVKSLPQPIEQVLRSRATARNIEPRAIGLDDLATMLHYSYGISRDQRDAGFPVPFRMIPSGGALYPLEVFFHTVHVRELGPGLYHYNPLANLLSRLSDQDQSKAIARGLVQPELAEATSIQFFITALFERSVFKYGERGYRFALLEAGHLAQNLGLVACALGLGCVNIGGFFDRTIDEFLGFDGLYQSTIYVAAVGQNAHHDGAATA